MRYGFLHEVNKMIDWNYNEHKKRKIRFNTDIKKTQFLKCCSDVAQTVGECGQLVTLTEDNVIKRIVI